MEPRDLEAVPRARSIAYVTDNAGGEFAVDAALIRALSKSSRVTVISRSLPYETDVVASYVRGGKVPGVEVLETGGEAAGFPQRWGGQGGLGGQRAGDLQGGGGQS